VVEESLVLRKDVKEKSFCASFKHLQKSRKNWTVLYQTMEIISSHNSLLSQLSKRRLIGLIEFLTGICVNRYEDRSVSANFRKNQYPSLFWPFSFLLNTNLDR